MERVYIFVDGSNLYKAVRQMFGAGRLDLEKLARFLTKTRKLVRVHYYSSPFPRQRDAEIAKNQQRFYEAVRRMPGFKLLLGRLEDHDGTLVEKGVDVRIAVDMLRMAHGNAYDTAILVSSDGDFVGAVEAIQELGKQVEVAYFHKAWALSQAADRALALNYNTLKGLMR